VFVYTPKTSRRKKTPNGREKRLVNLAGVIRFLTNKNYEKCLFGHQIYHTSNDTPIG